MTDLHFRIVTVPNFDSETDLSQLNQYVENCGLIVHSIKRLELENLNEFPFSGVIESVADVYAQNQDIISNKNKIAVYQDFSLKWYYETMRICGERPLLQFCNDECFERKRKSNHCYEGLFFSVSFGVHVNLGKYISYKTHDRFSRIIFDHDMQEIVLDYLPSTGIQGLEFELVAKTIKLLISYKHIRNIIISSTDNCLNVYLDLLHPPLFYEHKRELLNGRETFKRIMPFKVSKEILGKANVIKISINLIDNYHELISSLRSCCNKISVHFVAMKDVIGAPPLSPIIHFSHFGCTYLWTAILSRNFTILEQILDDDLDTNKLHRYCNEDSESLERTFISLLSIIESAKFVNYWYVIDVLYSSNVAHKKTDRYRKYTIPAKCRMIRRVTITPSRILFWPPDLMYENRILRNFNSEYFLRVTFRDDDFLTMNFRKYSVRIFQEITESINSGITVGVRRYELLGWSSSQLREHGVSMYSTDNIGRTASHIRRWTEIDPYTDMNIPKCLARMGQCFSQTDDTIYVPLDDIHVLFQRDIEHGCNPDSGSPYCFSDGIGKISESLADEVRGSLRHGENCSAFQIRYGGCKGMLVVDPTIIGRRIIFRNSMKKFNCRAIHHTKLEIAKKSGPISFRLNRPLIAILHDMGIPPVTFLRLQEDMLQNLLDMLLDETQAANYLNIRVPYSIFKITDLSNSGMELTLEPFFRTLLLSLHRYYIDIIKTKANIDINPAYARNMFGVLDETGTLEYGQVFVQYSTDITKGRTTPEDTQILKGTVMVTKCPCVHPGDVRKFTAVDVPELHHIIDCIVFPQRGPRPHPDEMAGADLDGDEFAVIWLTDLIFERENAIPANYPKYVSTMFQNVSAFLRHSQTEEIAEFLRYFFERDNIGAIASTHLALADQLGVESDECVEIAEIHAIAVDFAKTGYSNIPPRNPRKYPDFMEKHWKYKYKSKKSLGKMYRVSKDFENENEAISVHYRDIQVDDRLVIEGWKEFEEAAIVSRNGYNSALKLILQTYGIMHETQAFGGAFLKLHARFRERRDRAEIVSLVHMWLKELAETTKDEFFNEFKESGPLDLMNRRILCKASAWYTVTYRENEPEFLSFPWMVSEVLSNVLILNQGSVEKDLFPLISKLEKLVIQNEISGTLPKLPSECNQLLRNVYFHSQRSVVERAIAILSKWGEDEKIITYTHARKKFLYYRVFVKLILYVSELEGYVSETEIAPNIHANPFTSSFLCLAFFKYCMKLRFLNKRQMEQTLPFYVFNAKILAKRALVTLHSLAVTGMLSTLLTQEFMKDVPESVDMKPITIEVSVIGKSPLEKCKLRNCESILQSYTEVERVELRESTQKKKIIVSAFGTVETLRRLREILNKSTERLIEFFNQNGGNPIEIDLPP